MNELIDKIFLLLDDTVDQPIINKLVARDISRDSFKCAILKYYGAL